MANIDRRLVSDDNTQGLILACSGLFTKHTEMATICQCVMLAAPS
jgi:hypothetical protein